LNERFGIGWAALACAGLACGCSAPAACTYDGWLESPNLEQRSGGADDFDQTSAPVAHALKLELTDLPELWQGSKNLFGGYVSLSITTEYVGEPKGNDGKTQMPRVAASLGLDGADRHVETNTSSFAFGGADSAELRLFENCADDSNEPGCCAWGARECTVPLALRVERLDSAPFPPVTVAWSVKAGAAVTSCPLEREPQVQMALSEVSR